MPVISSLVLTNQNPVLAYTASVVTSGSTDYKILSDGLGNQLTVVLTTASYCNSASFVNYKALDGVAGTIGSLQGWVYCSIGGVAYKIPLYQ